MVVRAMSAYASPMRRSIGIAAWCVPAALATLQTFTQDSYADCGGSLWRSALREAVPWSIWAIATPFVLRAAPDARRHIARHVGALVAIALAFGAANGLLGEIARRQPSGLTMGGAIEMGIVDWCPIQPLVYAGVLATGIALDGARRRREGELAQARLATELATARLGALRAQIQPHFLFNTLNAAVALARSGDTEGCARVLELLGELLHQLLRAEAPQEVPLREELELVERYLEIQRVRFGDRLRVTWHIDDGVRDVLVPQLVLQPLVENAFRHGLSRRTLAGKLDIVATRIGDDLELAVHDDGPGPTEPVTFGVGLRNTSERLRQLYGERGTIQLGGDSAGARVAITLPIKLAVLA
jgi:two-component system, LytTR family, sensor kinase